MPQDVQEQHVSTIGTARNRERTGQRYVSKTSAIARKIKGVRHLDVDLVQYCGSCWRPEVFMEVKKYLVSDSEWRQMRQHAKDYNCVALLIIETLDDIGVKAFYPDTQLMSEVEWGGEERLTELLEWARDRHICGAGHGLR
jgi:hypothetical protein